jgi:DNA-binding beta-propeller fold protein YncE
MYRFSSRLLRTLSLTLLPTLALFLAFSFTKPFVVEATQVPTFLGYVGQIPTAAPGDHLVGFGYPNGVRLDQQGNMYVVDGYHVQKFDPAGNFTFSFGEYGIGDGQFNFLDGGITTDPSGNVYVVDSNNNRIQKFDSNGNFLMKFGTYGSGDGQFDYPEGVAVATSGEIYVSDGNHRIQKFDASGNFLMKFGSYGSGDGQLNWPYGIFIDSFGVILVVDSYNNRIQKFDANGNFLMKFGSLGGGDGQFN